MQAFSAWILEGHCITDGRQSTPISSPPTWSSSQGTAGRTDHCTWSGRSHVGPHHPASGSTGLREPSAGSSYANSTPMHAWSSNNCSGAMPTMSRSPVRVCAALQVVVCKMPGDSQPWPCTQLYSHALPSDWWQTQLAGFDGVTA